MHNYGSRQGVLNEKLSYFVQCRQNNVVALNGASQIYPILKEYFTGKKVLLPEITFGEYDRCFEDGCKYSDKFGFNLTEIEDKGRLSEVVVFVNPNNPTGSVLSTDWIYGYALNNQQKTILVDESFIEFSSNQSIVTLLEKKPLVNVIVLKSLSKVLGIPGVRLGYVYSCDSAFISMVNEKLPIWNLNSMAEYFLEILIKHRSDLAQSYSSTILDREQFARQLEGVKIVDKVFKSGGNFLLIRLSRDIIKAELILNQLLERHSIYVKDVSRRINDGKGYFRLAVRLPNENAKLVKCLKEMENV
jgi:histidinol-phosphate/aromatic aminotransferase/cobyric acid decarboxylase-like protein